MRFKQGDRSDQICLLDTLVQQQSRGWLVEDKTQNIYDEAKLLVLRKIQECTRMLKRKSERG